MWAIPERLTGRQVTLEPLQHDHAADLIRASAEGDQDQAWFTMVPAPDQIPTEITRRLNLCATGHMIPYAVVDHTGHAVGMTSFMNIDQSNKRMEIGGTWYRKSVQRTRVNTECKYLMLRHAFAGLEAIGIEFRTHVINMQSRRALERLGARLDGILRSHMITANGTIRDTAVYSITSYDWPTVRAHLELQTRRKS